MANIFKYAAQFLNGRRISTNSHYTGEHIGKPTQDGSVPGEEKAYEVENDTIRYGTVMQDSVAGSTPAIGVEVSHKLTNCSVDKEDGVYEKNASVIFTYTAESGYTLPSAITVKIGGVTKTAVTDYSWAQNTGKLTFSENKLNGDAEITITATVSQ